MHHIATTPLSLLPQMVHEPGTKKFKKERESKTESGTFSSVCLGLHERKSGRTGTVCVNVVPVVVVLVVVVLVVGARVGSFVVGESVGALVGAGVVGAGVGGGLFTMIVP